MTKQFEDIEVSLEKEKTNTSLSSTGMSYIMIINSELYDHNEFFMIGDDLVAEVSTRKNGRSDMEDRVNNVFKIY